MNRVPLLPLTKSVLVVSALIQIVGGLLMIFALGLVRGLVTPVPNPSGPALTVQYFGLLFLANGLGAVYALVRDDWTDARMYLVIAAPYVLLSLLLTIYAAATPPGVTPIAWVYVVLAAVYQPVVYWVWRQQLTQPATA